MQVLRRSVMLTCLNDAMQIWCLCWFRAAAVTVLRTGSMWNITDKYMLSMQYLNKEGSSASLINTNQDQYL